MLSYWTAQKRTGFLVLFLYHAVWWNLRDRVELHLQSATIFMSCIISCYLKNVIRTINDFKTVLIKCLWMFKTSLSHPMMHKNGCNPKFNHARWHEHVSRFSKHATERIIGKIAMTAMNRHVPSYPHLSNVYIGTQITCMFVRRPLDPAPFAFISQAVRNGRCTSKPSHPYKDGVKKCHGKLNLTCSRRSEQILARAITRSEHVQNTMPYYHLNVLQMVCFFTAKE